MFKEASNVIFWSFSAAYEQISTASGISLEDGFSHGEQARDSE
jgi:hypothetical protein